MIGFCLSVIDNKNKSFEFRRIVINPGPRLWQGVYTGITEIFFHRP